MTALKSPASNPALFRDLLVAWFDANGRDLPWRRTRDPYAILVSEIMLQQTQVATVIDYFTRWMERFPTVAALANAGGSEVLHAWQGLGYYSRARNLHETAHCMESRHAGQFPTDPGAMENLPGIGSYTAAAVATFAFDQPVPVLETNIIRLLSRLFDYAEPVDSAAGRAFLRVRAAELVPAANAGRYNAALMELGALVCVPRAPGCSVCPVHAFCAARDPAKLPVKKPRKATVFVDQECAFIERGNKILLEQQTGRRWRGMWCLPPHLESDGIPLLKLKYSITHHLVTLAVFAQALPGKIRENQRWVSRNSLETFPMPSPHRKALDRLLRHVVESGAPDLDQVGTARRAVRGRPGGASLPRRH